MISDLDDISPESPDQSSLRFAVCDYAATGEGHTVSILICTMTPQEAEWDRRPKVELGSIDRPATYDPGKLNCTPRDVLTRQVTDAFGSYFAIGVQFMEWEAMKNDYAEFLPASLIPRVEKRDCNLHFQTQVHFNFS